MTIQLHACHRLVAVHYLRGLYRPRERVLSAAKQVRALPQAVRLTHWVCDTRMTSGVARSNNLPRFTGFHSVVEPSATNWDLRTPVIPPPNRVRPRPVLASGPAALPWIGRI